MCPVQAWFAVATKPRSEAIAFEHLTRQGYACLLPRVRRVRRDATGMREKIECLFPSYLFLQADPDLESLAPVRSTRGAIGLVRFGSTPAQVPQDVIDRIRAQVDEDDGLVRLTAHGWLPGDRLRIADGPLSGIEGIFVADSGLERVRLLLDLLGTAREVIVPREQLAAGLS
ncbi:transcription termination/antitermination protein NusG [Thermomonas carbonis]|uniref:Transcription/translation regulatory transformer protein RfaH n=1 Tax=Thermomonas carbonis TaxID=1463158 RepID=A0A7G9SN26_9GAMM|nr:transcription termination/antitermination NusG family protein [Thermomonas carbonis]QNN69251.1 transcription/translation regulatory transformer protein RfaH [Thermomonas carbonis]GHC05713.1 transcription antitermination protein RfaH [Thermomonas carbonis]